MGGESSRGHFWATLPGILTGVAALLTALVGAAALFMAQDDPPDRTAGGGTVEAPGGPAGTPSSPLPPQPSRAGGQAPSGEPSPGAWTVVLRPGDWLNVGSRVSGTYPDGELVWGGSGVLHIYARHAVLDEETDRSGCAELLSRRQDAGLSPEQLRRGAVVCLSTDAGNLVELTISPPDVRDRLEISVAAAS